MKKIIIIILLTFVVSISFAQQYTPMTAAGYQMKRLKVDSTLHIPSFCGVPTTRNSTAKEGAVAMDTCNNLLYIWTNISGWSSISGGTIVDTAAINAAIALRVKYTDTAGMLQPYLRKIDTTNKWVQSVTKLNDSTIRVVKNAITTDLLIIGNGVKYSDTAAMLSKYLRKVDTASLSSRINLKLNISDTATMLSKYLRKTDTASLSTRINLKLNISDTSVMLSKYLRKTDTTSLSARINTKLAIADTVNKWVQDVTKLNDSTIRVRKNNTNTDIILPKGTGGAGSFTSPNLQQVLDSGNVAADKSITLGNSFDTSTIKTILSYPTTASGDNKILTSGIDNNQISLGIDYTLGIKPYVQGITDISGYPFRLTADSLTFGNSLTSGNYLKLSSENQVKLSLPESTSEHFLATSVNGNYADQYGAITISTGGITGSGTANYIPMWNGTSSLTNSTIVDSASSINYYRSGYRRSFLNNLGSQYWYVNDGASEAGWIGYGTPGGNPGIVMENASNFGRTDLRHMLNGGFSIAATTTGGIPSEQFYFHPTGNLTINQSADSNYRFLVNGDSKFTDSVKMSGLLSKTDTTVNKPLAIDASGNVVKMSSWGSGGGSGTVTSVATGYGLSGGTITTSGTLIADTSISGLSGKYVRIIDKQNGRFGNDTATIVMVKVHNDAGVTLTNGKVVALTTSGNNNEAPAVRLANNKGDSTSANTLGFVTGTIANQDTGWVILSGKIEKLNTSAFSNGDIIYLDSTSGNITKNKPVAPYHMVYLGVVVKSNAGNGAIFVKAQNGYELDEIHDVLITSKLNNQVLAYSDTQKVWKNRNIYSIVDTASLSSRINTKLAITDTSTFQRKSISAYSIMANNMPSAANTTAQVFNDSSYKTYPSANITWTGGTAPTTLTTSTYSFTQIGKMVTLYILLVYSNSGSSPTSLTLQIPSDCPQPSSMGTTPAAGNFTFCTGITFGRLNLTTQAVTFGQTSYMKRNAGNTAYEMFTASTTGAFRVVSHSFYYKTD